MPGVTSPRFRFFFLGVLGRGFHSSTSHTPQPEPLLQLKPSNERVLTSCRQVEECKPLALGALLLIGAALTALEPRAILPRRMFSTGAQHLEEKLEELRRATAAAKVG